MSVQTMDLSQVRSLKSHLQAVSELDDDVVQAIESLAGQLDGKSVLPVIGAGASFDCGMRLASEIAADLNDEYLDDETYAPHDETIEDDLGRLAEAIYLRRGREQLAPVKAVGLDVPDLWPAAGEVQDHFCALRVIVRLVREGAFRGSFSFNYDCCFEAALDAEGLAHGKGTEPGTDWSDHATVLCSKARNDDPGTPRSNRFVLWKAHGCAEHFRVEYEADPTSRPEDEIIIRAEQVERWTQDSQWACDELRALARSHILLLIGFSGQDPRIADALKSVLGEVERADEPRVVAIDYAPHKTPLQSLISAGAARIGGTGGVAEVPTSSGSTTAVLLLLLAERIRRRVEPVAAEAGLALPDEMADRVAMLTLAGPAMLRWSFLLRQSTLVQRTNAQIAGERGYAPLANGPAAVEMTVRALRARASLRQALGLTDPERPSDLISGHGAVTTFDTAYMPVGVGLEEVKAASRAGELAGIASSLLLPEGLERILVCEEEDGLHGVSVSAGEEVTVP
jgi:hypothetical protein